MTNLYSKTISICLVVNFPKEENFNLSLFENNLKDYLLKNSKEYFYILHDLDKNTEGKPKTLHYHVLYKLNNRTRLKTELFRICNSLFGSEEKINLLSIDKWNDYELGIQYLIHKNDKTKFQYNEDRISTNIPRGELHSILTIENSLRIDIDYLISVIDDCSFIWQVYQRLGINISQHYRSLIRDLFYARKGVSSL